MNNIGESGRKAEKKAAKKLGERQTPASGAMAGAKGDIKTKEYLIEVKSTKTKSFSIKHEWLEKICHEALFDDRQPMLMILFTDELGNPKKNGEWVAIPTWLAEEKGII